MAVVTVDGNDAQLREDLRTFGKAWWLFLVAGILWMWVGFAVLSFSSASFAIISIMIGFVLILAGIEELAHAFVMEGWRWFHVVLGLLFLAGGVYAFAFPGRTVGTLAILIAWFLLLKGTFDVVAGIASHGSHLWWLVLLTGVLEIGIAVWAIGYPGRSAALLILWVGIGALFRGIGEIVMAFQIRELKQEVQ